MSRESGIGGKLYCRRADSPFPILHSRLSSGFTLIELLVVVVIIGVLAAALVISIGGSTERELSNASDRFQALVAHACNQAELSGREIGISIAADGYAFSRLDRAEWHAFDRDGELRARSWPSGLHVELARAGRPLQLSTAGRDSPQLVCFSSGELTPFDVTLALGDAPTRYRIEGADDGTVKSTRVEATP
ncbi:MAG: type II secretion system minor pseudopilin GspH [Dokdonella sp.]